MWTGLQKPGAVPFVALIICSLLSLLPTLAKEWDLDFFKYGVDLAYLGFCRYDASCMFWDIEFGSLACGLALGARFPCGWLESLLTGGRFIFPLQECFYRYVDQVTIAFEAL